MAEERRYFQYLAGERKGEVVIFDKIEEEDGIIFISFKDGSRCNEELIIPLNQRTYSSELMAEVDSPHNVWTFKEEWIGRVEERYELNAEQERVCVQPFVQGRKLVTPIPPKPTKSNFGNITQSQSVPIQQSLEEIIERKTPPEDPVWIMCEKSKKFDTEVPMTLIVSLPSRGLYNVAKENFDGGGEKVVEYIINNLDNKSIKESLKKALLEAYGEVQEYFEPEAIEEPITEEPQAIGTLQSAEEIK
jgi:hypothetical protein